MALSEFGKEARKLRIDRDLLMKDLADRLGVTSTFLSAVEAGRKSIPAGFVERIDAAMGLTPVESRRLRIAADVSAREHRIGVPEGTSPLGRETASMLARRFSSLTEEDFRKIREVLDRRKA